MTNLSALDFNLYLNLDLDLEKNTEHKIVRITRREHDVLLGLSQGLSNKQLAKLLDIKVRTVESHVSSLFGKFNVTTRLQLISNYANLIYTVYNFRGSNRKWVSEKK